MTQSEEEDHASDGNHPVVGSDQEAPDQEELEAPRVAVADDQLRPHDFGVTGSWLNGGRSASFQQSLYELARLTSEALDHWTSRVEVDAGGLSTLTLVEVADEPLHYVEISLEESGQSAYVLFDLELALSLVTLMMGGNGDPGTVRPLTGLEARVVLDFVDALMVRFSSELDLGPARFRSHHSDQSTLRDGQTDTLLCFGLQFVGPKAGGQVRVAVSPLSLQAHMEVIDRRINGRRRTDTVIGTAAAAALQPVVVPVIVGFTPVRIPAIEMASLRPGDLLRTGQSVGRQLVASVGEVPVFTVKAGQRGDRLVAEILSSNGAPS